MLVKKVINCLVIGLILISCSLNRNVNDTLFNEEIGAYQKKIREFGFRLKPYSSGRLATINYGDEIDVMNKEQKDSILLEYKTYSCFLLEIDIDGYNGEISDYEIKGIKMTYEEKLNYYLFNMQKDLRLMDSKGNEYPCLVYYHERLNELNLTNRFIVGFRKPIEQNICFEYDNPLLNCGKIKFNLEEQHLAFK